MTDIHTSPSPLELPVDYCVLVHSPCGWGNPLTSTIPVLSPQSTTPTTTTTVCN